MNRTVARLTLLLGVMILILGASAEKAHSQSMKIGFIQDDKVVAGYDAWQRAQEQFQTEVKAWRDEADRMYNNYVSDSLEFEKQKLILSTERKVSRQAELNAKRNAYEAFTKDIFGPDGQAERKQAEVTKPLFDNINAAIEKVALEGNYDLILNSQGIAYINPALDVTDKVIEALQEEG